MHKHPGITQERIRQFLDFQLRESVIRPVSVLKTDFLPGAFPNEKSARSTKGWESIEPGFKWGPPYSEGWYHVKGSLPKIESNESLALSYGQLEKLTVYNWEHHPNVEGTLWQNNTQIGGLDFGHRFFRLPADTKKVDLLVQTYAHNLETTIQRPEKPQIGRAHV